MVPVKRLSSILRRLGFEEQSSSLGFGFNRPSSEAAVFEHVEAAILGKDREALGLSIAISVVRSELAQWKGLLVRGPRVMELYPEPELGHIEFKSREDWQEWLATFEAKIASLTSSLVTEKAAELLQATAPQRERAAHCLTLLQETKASTSPRTSTVELDAAIDRLSVIRPRPMPPELEAAIEGLWLARDPELLELVERPRSAAEHSVMRHIQDANAVPTSLAWTLMLVYDQLLRTTTILH
jgi:hypothetical protein